MSKSSSLQFTLFLVGTLAATGCAEDGEREKWDDAPSADALEPQGVDEQEQAYRYLRAYGYLAEEQHLSPGAFGERLAEALLLFQEIHGLPADGTLNDATRELMAQPRCAHPDHALVRKKLGGPSASYDLESKWPTNYITYSHSNFTSDLPTSTVEDALDVATSKWYWANQALTFQRLPSAGYISVGFATGDHGDGAPFTGTVLAHAFFPGAGSLAGDIHFDDDRVWTNNGVNGFNIYAVSIHEMGHALGLDHSSVAGSIMLPTYANTIFLGTDDVQAIRANYPPLPPASIDTQSGRCRGANDVYWPAAAGATYYEVYRSFASNFGSATLVHTTTATGYSFDVGVGATWYLRVKACNEMACGVMGTAQTSASYYNGCD